MRRLHLHRAPTLPAFRQALLDLLPLHDIAAARSTAVIVPTTSAADLLRRTIESRLTPGEAAVLPDIVTRGDWYLRLAARAAVPMRLLGPFERDVLMEAAAHAAITDGATPPFHLRSALVGEIVDFYDAVRRQRQSVEAFERLVLDPLTAEADSEGDAGAERVLRQTRFLAATFRGYESRRDRLGALDEHTLRERLPDAVFSRPYHTIIVTVADSSRDSNGLWSADFELLARLPSLEALEIVATESMLATGWLERLHDLLPGLTSARAPSSMAVDGEAAFLDRFDSPRLLIPDGPTALERRAGLAGKPFFVSRDREEELRDLVTRIRSLLRDPESEVALDRIAVVFDRPLPYVYLAREVFGLGGVPFEARDALPLGAEPFSAAVDLAVSCTASQFSTPSLVALLGSPHFQFATDGDDITLLDVAALDAALEEGDCRGDPDRLESLAEEWLAGTSRSPYARWDAARAARAGRAGAEVIRALAPLASPQPASVQLDRLGEFVDAHLRPVREDDPLQSRLLRAQQAVRTIVRGLAAAHRAHNDLRWSLGDLASALRHHIERQTFTPDTGESGVQLVDAAAAPFGEFDSLHLVGLVDGEWPRRQRRNIFYSQGLLTALGWPDHQADRLAPARATFVDLLQSPAFHASVSTFSLEDDSLVEPSVLLDDIGRAGLTPVVLPVPETVVFIDDALTSTGGGSAWSADAATALDTSIGADALEWLKLRRRRPAPSLSRFHGDAGAQKPRPRSVSALELYAQCPFKFYSRYVLRLAEERDDDDGLTPLERGRLHHELFEAIFSAWQARGRGTVTPELFDEARALALATMESHLDRLSPADAALERTRLVGSPVAPGLIDVVLRLEAERPARVVERRLEHKIDGVYQFRGADGVREIEVRGIADRVDLLADGTFRVFDYKASKPGSMLQIAVYATCLRQRLRAYRGRDWQLAEAAYVAFRGDRTVVPLTTRPGDNDAALADAEREIVEIADAIAAGVFPPRPRTRSLCQSCAFAAVCRKDYVDAAEPTPAV